MADWFATLKRLLTYEVTIGKLEDDEPEKYEGTVLPVSSSGQLPLTQEDIRLQKAQRTGLIRNQLQTGLDEQVPLQAQKVTTEWSQVIGEICETWQTQRAACTTDRVREQVTNAQDHLYQELVATARQHVKDFTFALRDNNQQALDALPQPRQVIEQKRLELWDRVLGRTWEVRDVND